ncbi:MULTISPECIES: DUF2243 domain-containing protein [Cyanophyceae]|uniref:DUF2243 domain-containing protein n=1 Tax=Cyanophyceae TaxID=3028117 RepID=UPI0016874241|nr:MULTISPECIES: DUF2243 domain-containing protein [Cyanophyceae]MBD1918274.1 DUF2243 domain-containing protein [Phormidium sp. FACHB-77]MBD2031318.1 DUF2243 domain-containing protein [Phormidium sp. FACHB-322]MBD2052385.1 DUF2243 domain-containing protein [Leptolyngbya sp. FACHB-60]
MIHSPSPGTAEKPSAFPIKVRSFKVAGFLIGFGLGGFIDAIVLHMLLQWHHLVSGRVPMNTLVGLQRNVMWDGVLSAGMWLVVVVGLGVLWRGVQQTPIVPLTTSAFVGWILMGWGGFQLFDSVFFHALLGLHHIRPGPNYLFYDAAFFLIGLVLLGLGFLMTRNQVDA